MAIKHGKIALMYLWDKTATTMTAEACTVSGNQAQITAVTKRRLNPNEPPVFTDSGGKTVIYIDYINGIAYFTGNATIVTCTGEYVLQANLANAGYLIDWSLNLGLATADGSSKGDAWDNPIAGRTNWNGSANRHYQSNEFTLLVTYETSPVEKRLFLLEFYTDAVAQLDRYVGWALVSGVNPTSPLTDTMKEAITITGFQNIGYFTT